MNDVQPSSGEPDPAAALFEQSVGQAAAQNLPITGLFLAATRLKQLNQPRMVAGLYKTWIAFNPDAPLLHAAYFNFGVALSEEGDGPGAINALRECIRLRPDFYPPYINLGRALEDSSQVAAALAQWGELVSRLASVSGESLAHKKTALQQTGRVLEGLFQDAAAEESLRQCLDLDPRQADVVQHWIALRQRQCKWPVIQDSERVKRTDLLESISPLSLANLADDPMFQLAKAYGYCKSAIGLPKPVRRWREAAVRPRSGPLKIGYVSSDLREHAVGFGMAEVMELHDRARVEVHAYYCGITRTDPTQDRIRGSVDRWTDIGALDDQSAAQRIAADGIDILVDLNGYTKSARTKVFAMRPAPIGVNWFGFPGTMGSPYHHYIVADLHVIPEECELYYSEKVLRLPCYQPNDRKRVVSPTRPSRADERLPETAFVFCCLNGMQKLTPPTFMRWITILHQVPGSVLWLLTGTQDTNQRLQHLAEQHGIEPQRLIFADKKPNPDHLARYPLADLFLDNLPYGAHTTAADALWMGVPVLTLEGKSFASRVCGSLVRAAGLEGLVCTTPQDYLGQAIALGRDPSRVAELKARLAANRATCALFDTPELVRRLEALYGTMWAAFERGQLPVPNLVNLDVYHEVGLGLDLESLEDLPDGAYRALYRERLAERHDVYPVAPDGRLWP